MKARSHVFVLCYSNELRGITKQTTNVLFCCQSVWSLNKLSHS
jgi:hypothetical protein